MNELGLIQRHGNSHTRSATAQRWGALLGGGALALYGLTRRSKGGYALATAGGVIALLGARANTRRDEVTHSSVIINASPEEVYQFWHNFEQLPLFMHHLESVRVTGERTSRWVALGPLGTEIEWDAEIVSDVPNSSIRWRSLPGSDLIINGVVEFRVAPGNRGTLVKVLVHYEVPTGVAGLSIAKLLGKNPNFMMRQDLRRLKALMEAGEIPTIEGQTHGPRSAVAAVARVVDPDRPVRLREARIRDVITAKRRIA